MRDHGDDAAALYGSERTHRRSLRGTSVSLRHIFNRDADKEQIVTRSHGVKSWRRVCVCVCAVGGGCTGHVHTSKMHLHRSDGLVEGPVIGAFKAVP